MKPSNLVILMSDEHTRRITGCYGHSKVLTPNIDSIAARGVRFENAYCNSPICVPSRASFVTGRYVHKTGNWDNAAPVYGSAGGLGTPADESRHPADDHRQDAFPQRGRRERVPRTSV